MLFEGETLPCIDYQKKCDDRAVLILYYFLSRKMYQDRLNATFSASSFSSRVKKPGAHALQLIKKIRMPDVPLNTSTSSHAVNLSFLHHRG